MLKALQPFSRAKVSACLFGKIEVEFRPDMSLLNVRSDEVIVTERRLEQRILLVGPATHNETGIEQMMFG